MQNMAKMGLESPNGDQYDNQNKTQSFGQAPTHPSFGFGGPMWTFVQCDIIIIFNITIATNHMTTFFSLQTLGSLIGPPQASAITLLLERGVLSQPLLSYWCVVFSNIINAMLCQQHAWSACSSRPHELACFMNTWLFSSPPLSHFYFAEAQWRRKACSTCDIVRW